MNRISEFEDECGVIFNIMELFRGCLVLERSREAASGGGRLPLAASRCRTIYNYRFILLTYGELGL